MPLQIPTWIAVLPVESDRITRAFRDVLGRLSLTRAELGRRMGLGPSTVGNWASGSQRPSLESMKSATEALRATLGDLQEDATRMQEILDLVDENISAGDLHREERTHESLDALLAASRSLSATLDAMGIPMEEKT